MNMERQLREEERIRAGYYQQHNYTWQYVLQPEEYQDLLSREVNGKHLQIHTRFILKIIGQTLFDLK